MKILQIILLFLIFVLIIPCFMWVISGKISDMESENELSDSVISVLKNHSRNLKREVLDNGMTCLVMEDHTAPAVSIQIWVGTGSIHEDKYLGSGLCHAIEHMIFKGTEKLPLGEMSRLIANAGGNLNAYTSHDRTVYHADMPSSGWKVGLQSLADAMQNATFPGDEWEKERNVILREISMGNDNPDSVISKMLFSTAFSVHPCRHPVIGHKDILINLKREDLVSFYRQNYVPDNMIVVVAGDVSKDEVISEIKAGFAGFKRRARPAVILPSEPPQLSTRRSEASGAYNISRLEMAYHTVPVSHPDAPVLDVLATIIGSGKSSRLVKKFVEEKKLVQHIDAWSSTPKEEGLFGISVEFEPGKEQEVIDAIQLEIVRLTKEGFTNDELNKVKRMILNNSLSELQTMHGQSTSYASGEFYCNDPFFTEKYLERLSGITLPILKKTAIKYLQPDNLTIALLTPEKQTVKSQMTEFRKVPLTVSKKNLPNGMTLLVHEDHRFPFVYICATAKGGLLYEDEKNNGISTLMANMLVRGTKTRNSEHIAYTLESRGGSLVPSSSYNTISLSAKCFSPDAPLFMDIMADCLFNPVFPTNEIPKQKMIQQANIKQDREHPMFLARDAFRNMIFPGHPYRMPLQGNSNSVENITRSDLQNLAKTTLTPDNIVISVFGDITFDQADKLLVRYFNKPKSKYTVEPRIGIPQPILPARSERTAPKEQAIIILGFPGVGHKDPRVDALNILDTAINGLSAELFNTVREQRGLTYYVGGRNLSPVNSGCFFFYAGTKKESISEVEGLILQEVSRITAKGLSQEEVDRAKKQMIAEYDITLQDIGSICNATATDELLGLGYEHALNFRERISAVNADTIQKAAASIMSTNTAVVSIVLPEGNKEEQK